MTSGQNMTMKIPTKVSPWLGRSKEQSASLDDSLASIRKYVNTKKGNKKWIKPWPILMGLKAIH